MNRRALLSTVGTSVSLVTGGCLSSFQNSYIQLGYLDVYNYDRVPRQFEIRVFRDDTEVHSSSHEIKANEAGPAVPGTAVDCTWDEAPGEHTVVVRIVGGERYELPLTYDDLPVSNAECVVLAAMCQDNEVIFSVGSSCDREYDGMCSFVGE